MPLTQGAYTGALAISPIHMGSAFVLAIMLAACSVDIPIPGFSAQNTTAAIDTDASRLSSALTTEDWTLARTALKKALETPASVGLPATPAAWGNPNSGLHGTFARDPDTKAQWLAEGGPKEGTACQYFVASIAGAAEPAEREGLACRDKSGQWTIKDARDRAKS